ARRLRRGLRQRDRLSSATGRLGGRKASGCLLTIPGLGTGRAIVEPYTGQNCRTIQCASGSGRICTLYSLGRAAVPPSLWNSVRVPVVVHNPLPFQLASGLSMRPSTFLLKKPIGYG